MPNTPQFKHFLLSTLLVIPTFGGSARAQPAADAPNLRKQPQAATGAVTLADEPYRLDSVGLSVRIPLGSQVQSSRVGDRQTAVIIPDASTWRINIQTPATSVETGTIAQALDNTLKLIRASYSVFDASEKNPGFFDASSQAKIIERTPDLKLTGGKAARLYVSTPRGDTKKSRLVKGYTIFKPAPKQFVVFEFICHESDFDKLRGTYETVVGTALFESEDSTSMARAAAVKAGVAFMDGVTEQDILAAMGPQEVWFRMFKPGKTGLKMDDEEVGYKGLRFWKGKRGEINPGKPRNLWKSADEQDGYLAQLRSRVLWNKEILDTQALYFMTPDRSEESWTITMGVKDDRGSVIRDASETGARINREMIIVKTESKKPPVTLRPPIMGDGYISQFESLLMPRLLVHKRVQTELGWYCWQNYAGSDSGTISFRKDSLSMQSDGRCMVTTNLRDDSAPQVGVYAASGELIRSELPGNIVWEPMDLTTLKQLWQRKGHPVNH